MATQTQQSASSFDGLGIAANFLKILENLKFTVPTPIQHQAIPIAITGKDIIGIAQTGTGKTLAFGVPMIQRLAQEKGRGLVLLPTRELAQQVEEVLQRIGKTMGLRTAVLIGGAPMGRQLQALRARPHIIIATPGRLLDHAEHRSIDFREMTIVVLDEADRMLDMGFAPQIKKVLAALPRERQIMLFSATMPRDIVRLATEYMKLPLQIEVAPAGTLAERVEQELYMVRKEDRIRLLDTLLSQYKRSILIFSRTKHGAKRICRSVNGMGHKAVELHSNRSLAQRQEAMAGFKSGKYRVLVATDIAARGIDVSDIEIVINFDIPDDPEDYVHRIGRTGRAGKTGKAISFVAPDQRGKVKDIERLTRTTLSLSQPPVLAPARPEPVFDRSRQFSGSRQPSRFSSGGGSRFRDNRSRRETPHRDGGRPGFSNTRRGAGGKPGDTRRSSFSDQYARPGGNERTERRPGFSNTGPRRDDRRPGFASAAPRSDNRYPLQSNKFESHQSPDEKFFSRPQSNRPHRDFKRGNRRTGGARPKSSHHRSF